MTGLFLVALTVDTIRTGDILSIRLGGYDYEAKVVVREDSTVLLQPFGYIRVGGLDIFSARDTIFARVKDYYPSAVVILDIVNRMEPVVYLATSDGNNASVPYRKGMTIRDAILLSNVAPYKDIRLVELYRDSMRFELDRNAAIPVMPGDLLYLRMARKINWQMVWMVVNTATSFLTLLTVLGVVGR